MPPALASYGSESYLGCNILAEEKGVSLSNIRYRDDKQRCARLSQVASETTTIETESPGEGRSRHVLLRETVHVLLGNQLRESVSVPCGDGKKKRR